LTFEVGGDCGPTGWSTRRRQISQKTKTAKTIHAQPPRIVELLRRAWTISRLTGSLRFPVLRKLFGGSAVPPGRAFGIRNVDGIRHIKRIRRRIVTHVLRLGQLADHVVEVLGFLVDYGETVIAQRRNEQTVRGQIDRM